MEEDKTNENIDSNNQEKNNSQPQNTEEEKIDKNAESKDEDNAQNEDSVNQKENNSRLQNISIKLKRSVNNLLKRFRTIISILCSPITWITLLGLFLSFVFVSGNEVIGENQFARHCLVAEAPSFSNGLTEAQRSNAIVDYFGKSVLTPKQAMRLSIMMKNQSGLKGVYTNKSTDGNYACDNDCMLNQINTDKNIKIGLLGWSGEYAKALLEYAKGLNKDWSETSVQLDFLNKEMSSINNLSKKSEDEFISALSNKFELNYSGDKDKDEMKQIEKDYKENKNALGCEIMGDAKKSRFGSGMTSLGIGNFDFSAVKGFNPRMAMFINNPSVVKGSVRQAALMWAALNEGVPYNLGAGHGVPFGFYGSFLDCSSFVCNAWGLNGGQIDRVYSTHNMGSSPFTVLQTSALPDLSLVKPGDAVWVHTGTNQHVEMFLGYENGRIITTGSHTYGVPSGMSTWTQPISGYITVGGLDEPAKEGVIEKLLEKIHEYDPTFELN